MTREERALKVLINVQAQFQASLDEVDVDKDCKEAEEDNTEVVNALEMAIKALKQKLCEDAISRQEVDRLSKELVHTTRDKADFLCNFLEELQKLPPVNPQEPILTR